MSVLGVKGTHESEKQDRIDGRDMQHSKMIPNPSGPPPKRRGLSARLTIDDCIQMGTCPEDAFPSEYDKDIRNRVLEF